ncbi:MAG: glycoside hydrolase family 127 protein, partial [Muribaculaceae bacterium]|nr:glycoside hydrolase family 127 protein [Muribaculaceae bacterium]
ADVYERALYNGVPSGVSLSGDKFFYDNPLESMGQHERAPWFGCACCPGNVTRFMASVPNYMYATQGDDIFVNLYIQSDADITTENNKVKIRQETEYPWQGKVKMTVTPAQEGEFAVRVRIPGWSQESPVPTDLYSFTRKAADNYTLTVNGSEADVLKGDGYATLKRTWRPGDVIELTLPMETRRVRANENVADDRGKLAIQRGPVMYCLEGRDQSDSTVFDKYIPEDTRFEESYRANMLNGVMTLSGKARKVMRDGSEQEVNFTAIPYCTWNNRGNDQMAVWIPASADRAVAVPEPTLASRAEMYSEPTILTSDAPAATSNLNWAWGYNDQWEPVSSADTSKPYHYWWLRQGTQENLCYRWNEPQKVSSVDVYW